MLTRYMGVALYGKYSLVIALTGMFSIIADLGTGTIATRELSVKNGQIGIILPNIIALKAALAIITSLAVVLTTCLLGYEPLIVSLSLLYSLMFFAHSLAYNTLGLKNIVDLKIYKNIIADIISNLIFLCYVYIGLCSQADIKWFVVGGVLMAFCQSLFVYLLTRKQVSLSWSLDFSYCWWMIKESAPLAVATIFSIIYFKIDIIMLSRMKGEAAVGIYNAGYKFIESLTFFSMAFLSSIFPLLSHYFAKDKDMFRKLYLKSMDVLTVIAFSLGLALFVCSEPLILKLCGSDYLDSIGVLKMCAPALMLMFINNLGAHLLFAANKQRYFAWINLIAAIINILLNLLLIPRFSYMGAAFTTLVTEIFICACIDYLVYKNFSFPAPYKSFAKLTLLALFIVGLNLTMLPSSNLMYILFLSILYVVLLFGCKIISKADILLLVSGKGGL